MNQKLFVGGMLNFKSNNEQKKNNEKSRVFV